MIPIVRHMEQACIQLGYVYNLKWHFFIWLLIYEILKNQFAFLNGLMPLGDTPDVLLPKVGSWAEKN